MSTPLLEVKDLCKRYPIYGPLGKLFPPKTHMNAVSGLSLQLYEGETYGLVGESGCGKTTTGRCILGLTHPDGGEIQYQGHDLTKLSDREFRPLRRDIQLVFQDPLSSLNPRQRIGSLLEEPLIIQGMEDADARRARVLAILEKVGLSEEHYFRYPHELSGGQVQRLGIARALIIEPKLIVCDEPVSALDVSIQAQILNLLMELQAELKLSYLFISHDLNVVRHISNRVGIMYLGRMVEQGETEEVYRHPTHPYTQALLSAIPKRDPSEDKVRIHLDGDVPNPADPPKGCPFHDRCPKCMEVCKSELPVTREVSPGHFVSCHLLDK